MSHALYDAAWWVLFSLGALAILAVAGADEGPRGMCLVITWVGCMLVGYVLVGNSVVRDPDDDIEEPAELDRAREVAVDAPAPGGRCERCSRPLRRDHVRSRWVCPVHIHFTKAGRPEPQRGP